MSAPLPIASVRRSNNFDALRIAAALAVIVGHAADLSGHPEQAPVVFGLPISQLGVAVFFVISGYLITGSWSTRPVLARYLTHRVLRIIPGLVFVTLLCAFVLGPLVTSLTPGQYFANPATWTFLRNAVLLPDYDLPGVFTANPYPIAVNGSLWTLPAEFACYLVVPVIALLPKRFVTLGWAAFGIISIVLTFQQISFFGARVESASLMWVFFAGGAIIRLSLDRKRIRLDVAAAILIVWLTVVAIVPTVGVWMAWFALPYCVLALGISSTPVLRRVSRFGDFSYGLYLWAFPVQQTVIHLFGVLPRSLDLVIVVIITGALAVLSWHLVERRSMDLARRLPWSKDAARTVASAATHPVAG